MRVFVFFCIIILYTSCKNDNAVPIININTDTVSKSDELIIIDSISEKDSLKNHTSNPQIDKKLNSREEFDPKKEPSSIIPKHPVMRQMPLPGGVPDKHYIDSIKVARSKK